MKDELALETPTLIRGAGIAIGEFLFGPNGPFLFSRFGLNVPEAVACGCLLGAALGCSVAGIVLRLRHKAPVPAKGIPHVAGARASV